MYIHYCTRLQLFYQVNLILGTCERILSMIQYYIKKKRDMAAYYFSKTEWYTGISSTYRTCV